MKTQGTHRALSSDRALAWIAGLAFLSLHALWYGRVWPISSDGSHYLAIARELRLGHGPVDPIGFVGHPAPRAALHWPPLYPMAIAALNASGLGWVAAARLVSLAGTLAAVVVFARLIASYARGPARLVGVAWIATVPALAWHSELVASDGLSVGLVALTFLLLDRARGGLRAPEGFALGLVSGLAVATRWAVVALALPIAWRGLHELRAKRPGFVPWALASMAGAASVLAPLVWWRLQVGDGPRAPTIETPASLAHDAVLAVVKVWGVNTLALGLLPALVALSWEDDVVTDDEARDTSGVFWEHGVFVVTVIAIQLVAALQYRIDTLGSRLLLPATPSMVLMAVLLAPRLRAASRWRPGPRLTAAAAAGAVFVALATHAVFVRRWATQRQGRAAIEVVLPALARLPAGAEVYTDAAELITYRLDLRWTRREHAPNGAFGPISAARADCVAPARWWVTTPETLGAPSMNEGDCAAAACLRALPCAR
ncbi:MAG: hypothetical protein U0326_14295 [Polyangiales bacterium]